MLHENLWAPWRMAYIRQLEPDEAEASPGESGEPGAPGAGCFLCQGAEVTAESEQGRQRLVLINNPHGIVLLNRYPYTNGHLLVSPREHLADLSDMTRDGRTELMELVNLAQALLHAAINPQGINIGMNLGRCAGAGIPGHLHVHIVPRWAGDTNFMTTIAQVRVVPQALEESYRHLKQVLTKMQS